MRLLIVLICPRTDYSMYLFIYLFGVLRCFQHCTGHIPMGSWKGRGNQYIWFVRVLYCKLPTNGKQLPAFPLEAVPGIEPRPQRWEARVLPLCHHGPNSMYRRHSIYSNFQHFCLYGRKYHLCWLYFHLCWRKYHLCWLYLCLCWRKSHQCWWKIMYIFLTRQHRHFQQKQPHWWR